MPYIQFSHTVGKGRKRQSVVLQNNEESLNSVFYFLVACVPFPTSHVSHIDLSLQYPRQASGLIHSLAQGGGVGW